MSIAEPRTIGEAYTSATGSSDLRVRTEVCGDVDLLIAAGWIADGIGPMLHRLCREFDTVRVVVRGPGQLSPVERFLILDKLKTLRAARQVLGEFALLEAEKTGFARAQTVVFTITGRVLDVFLDPNCHHCEGRGFNGGSHRGEPKLLCRPCGGSTHRRDQIGKDDQERSFAAHLLTHLMNRLGHVEWLMKRYLRA